MGRGSIIEALVLASLCVFCHNVKAFLVPCRQDVVVVGKQHSQTKTSSSLLMSSTIDKKLAKTPAPKFPVERGTTVDSRDIISKNAITAVRLSHILFASSDLATVALNQLLSKDESIRSSSSATTNDKNHDNDSNVDFVTLAEQISNCEFTRSKKGDVGWVSTDASKKLIVDGLEVGINDHLDDIIPPDAREEVVRTSTKPGDVFLVQSTRGVHLVQIKDVMVDVKSLALKKARKRPKEGEDVQQQQQVSNNRSRQRYYKMETMGCQMNAADSERIEGQMQSIGILPLPQENSDDISKNQKRKNDIKQADVVILNTCSIRDHAEQKVYSYIGPYSKRKREGEDVTIVVAGCVAQQEGEELLRRVPEIDLVMGPQFANRISDLLEDVDNGNQVVATEASHIMEDSTKPRRSSQTCAWVNIIYGCNERCTYCIVPTTRGVEQSRPVESIVDEIQDLVDNGYKEITLLGQNIDAYGRDMKPKRKFSDLLRIVGTKVPGLKRVRFVTSHPRYMSMGVVDAVAETQPTLCQNFHVPFQSGSNKILSDMGRGHTREKYLQIIDRIKSKLPDASITADVIVGFPGETEEDFQQTLDLMNEVVFDSVNTAAYSPRPNTPAATWTNQLSEEVKKDRLSRINELNLKHARTRRQRMVGRTVEILVEERNVKIPSQVMGRTTQGYIVYCDGDIDKLRSKLVNVHITNSQTYSLTGDIVQTEEGED